MGTGQHHPGGEPCPSADPRDADEHRGTGNVQLGLAANILRGYCIFSSDLPLNEYWRAWVTRARTLILQDAGFYIHDQAHDETNLMQFANSNPANRAVRPRRPQVWTDAVRSLCREAPHRQAPRGPEDWLQQQILRLGHPMTELGMMLRESQQAVCPAALSVEENVQVQRLTRDLREKLRQHLHEGLQHPHRSRTVRASRSCNRTCTDLFDDLDVDKMGLNRQERDRQEFEEIQLQYIINEDVRARVPAEPGVRAAYM